MRQSWSSAFHFWNGANCLTPYYYTLSYETSVLIIEKFVQNRVLLSRSGNLFTTKRPTVMARCCPYASNVPSLPHEPVLTYFRSPQRRSFLIVKQAGRNQFPPRYSDHISYKERSLFKSVLFCAQREKSRSCCAVDSRKLCFNSNNSNRSGY